MTVETIAANNVVLYIETHPDDSKDTLAYYVRGGMYPFVVKTNITALDIKIAKDGMTRGTDWYE